MKIRPNLPNFKEIIFHCLILDRGHQSEVDWILVSRGLVFEIEAQAHKPKNRTAHAREHKNKNISFAVPESLQ